MTDKKRFIISFIVVLVIYSLSGLLSMNSKDFYEGIQKPVYAPNNITFMIVWPILFITISLFFSYSYANSCLSQAQFLFMLVNILCVYMYPISMFFMKNLLLGFIFTLGSFLSMLLIYLEAFKTSRVTSSLLVPYLLWTLFACFLQANIYLLNY